MKLRLTKDGYVVPEMCGKCDKCNGIFAASGCIPCPRRWYKADEDQKKIGGIYDRDFF